MVQRIWSMEWDVFYFNNFSSISLSWNKNIFTLVFCFRIKILNRRKTSLGFEEETFLFLMDFFLWERDFLIWKWPCLNNCYNDIFRWASNSCLLFQLAMRKHRLVFFTWREQTNIFSQSNVGRWVFHLWTNVFVIKRLNSLTEKITSMKRSLERSTIHLIKENRTNFSSNKIPVQIVHYLNWIKSCESQ